MLATDAANGRLYQQSALSLEQMTLRAYAEEDHDFGYELVIRVARVILQRLQAARQKLTDFYGAVKDPDSNHLINLLASHRGR